MKIKAENAPALVTHCEHLCLLAGVEPNFHTGYKLYEKLRRLELKAHRLAERECNGNTYDTDITLADRIQVAVIKLFNYDIKAALYINGDPRGYALKLDGDIIKEFIRKNNFYRDFGGYGILAPEF